MDQYIYIYTHDRKIYDFGISGLVVELLKFDMFWK